MTHVHFIGISGSGLSAIARLLLESGFQVSGSDRLPGAIAVELEQLGARIFTGHAAENIEQAEIIVRSSAVPENNPEVVAARLRGTPVLKRNEFLHNFLAGRKLVAIAGTHGKTTTTAMTAWALNQAGCDPSYIIGGISKDLGANAHAGQGPEFVIEADEYDRMFLGLDPQTIVVTYLEHDHPDCYPSMDDYQQAFVDFIQRLQPGGILIVNGDHSPTAALSQLIPAGCRAYRVGLNPEVNYRATNIQLLTNGSQAFDLIFTESGQSQSLGHVALNIAGEHNLRNALCVLAAAHQNGWPLPAIGQALQRFQGTGRRFDQLGEVMGINIIDDYAHHPTEIRATLQAARARFGSRRIWAVWQPHTFSRTQTLLPDFVNSFEAADQVIVTEIYAAREQYQGFSSRQVVEQMPHSNVHFSPTLADATHTLLAELRSGDVLLVLSAGDADAISRDVLAALQQKAGLHG